MKKFISLLLAAILLTLTVTSCGAGVPDVEEIKPRLTELIEASYEINDIFFGEHPEISAKVRAAYGIKEDKNKRSISSIYVEEKDCSMIGELAENSESMRQIMAADKKSEKK